MYIVPDNEWLFKLGGFKNSSYISDLQGSYDQEVENEMKMLAIVIYSIFRKSDFTGDGTAIHFDFELNEKSMYYKHMAKHLVEVIYSNPRIEYDDILTHPLFWSIEQLVAYEDRLRSYVSHKPNKFLGKYWNIGQKVFTGDWTDNLEDAVRDACMLKTPPSSPRSPSRSPPSAKGPLIPPRPTFTSSLRARRAHAAGGAGRGTAGHGGSPYSVSPRYSGSPSSSLSSSSLATPKKQIPPNKSTFTGLWTARRNRRHHRDEDGKDVREIMGKLPRDNFIYWGKKFPTFELHLFLGSLKAITTEKAHIYETPEFDDYLKGSSKFYEACSRVEI